MSGSLIKADGVAVGLLVSVGPSKDGGEEARGYRLDYLTPTLSTFFNQAPSKAEDPFRQLYGGWGGEAAFPITGFPCKMQNTLTLFVNFTPQDVTNGKLSTSAQQFVVYTTKSKGCTIRGREVASGATTNSQTYVFDWEVASLSSTSFAGRSHYQRCEGERCKWTLGDTDFSLTLDAAGDLEVTNASGTMRLKRK
jgi:hypothetical protein